MDEAGDFLASLPVPPTPVADALFLSMHSRRGLRRAVQSLAQHGYIGCLPFAPSIVVRLLPTRNLHHCPIGVVLPTDAITIAPALQHFVAGRLAQVDATKRAHNERVREALIEYAAALGSAESTQTVLAACPRVAKEELSTVRRAMLWAAVGEFDQLFKALGGAWQYSCYELIEWLRALGGEARGSHIIDRVSVGCHTKLETGTDVSEPAWRIVTGDHVFDLGYTGLGSGPTYGSKVTNALILAVQFLRRKTAHDPRMDSPGWRAAQAAVDDPRYDGNAHIEAARAIAADDAAGAYTFLANAARYASRSNKRLLPQILGFALELATANQWHILAAALTLAQPSSRNPASSETKTAHAKLKQPRPSRSDVHPSTSTELTALASTSTVSSDEAVDFIESLPVPTKPAAKALGLSMYSGGELRRAVKSLALKGFIGCLPFAHDGGCDIVVRLLPAQSPHDCAIAAVFRYLSHADTIAPALKHFVAGRLAHLAFARARIGERIRKALLDYAASLGSTASLEAVLAALQLASKRKTWTFDRVGLVYTAAGKFDPLFEALGGAWRYEDKKLIKWVRTLRGQASSSHIVDRVSVGCHTHHATGEDVSEPAWRIVMGDQVFDRRYTGLNAGTFVQQHMNALTYAVKFLREKGSRDERMDSLAWRAAQAAIDDRRYGGEMHFDAARAMATDDAAGAYTFLANAALYAHRGNKHLRPEILGFALELAAVNQWSMLAATLKLAQGSSRKLSSSPTSAKSARGARKQP